MSKSTTIEGDRGKDWFKPAGQTEEKKPSKEVADLQRQLADLQRQLAAERKNYQELRSHHNTHCTCMDIY